MKVLLTGATSGIGYELAQLFAKDGHDLTLVARRKDVLDQLGDKLSQKHSISVSVQSLDLGNPHGVEKLVGLIQDEIIHCDILVNNAGVGYFGEFKNEKSDELQNMLQLNILSLTQLCHAATLQMIKRGVAGKILNVASIAGFLPGPHMAAYYASKAYVLSLSEALSEELKPLRISVSCLCPGPTKTGFFKEAGMKSEVEFLKRPGVLDAKKVAEAGYRGLMKNQTLILPGVTTKAVVQVLRLLPRSFTRAAVSKFQSNRK